MRFVQRRHDDGDDDTHCYNR
jgi:uncharacterized protein YjbI with pentapeptide repeats